MVIFFTFHFMINVLKLSLVIKVELLRVVYINSQSFVALLLKIVLIIERTLQLTRTLR